MEDNILKATHFGKIIIGEKELTCAVLEDGTRILSSTAMFKAFDRPRKGKSPTELPRTELPLFMEANNLQPYLDRTFQTGTAFYNKVTNMSLL